MIVSPNINKDYQHTLSGNTSITCKTMVPDTARKKMPIYEIDLENVYPIVMLNVSGLGVYNNTVFLRIDKQPCTYFQFPTGLYKWAVLTCNQYRRGRVVSVTTEADFHICSLRVYTCIDGLQGPQCEDPCSPGKFGAGCVYSCKCRDGKVCDARTGFCPTGCQNILADGDFGCIVKKPRIFETLDMIRLTTSTVIKLRTSPTAEDIGSIIQTRTGENVSQNCMTLLNSTRLTVTLTYARPVNLEGVIIHHSFNISLPLHFYLAADGRLCRQAIFKYRFPSGSQKYLCQRKGVTGTQVQISYIIPRYHQRALPGLKICQLGILECSKGFYGPRCRISCNCMSTGCDGHTGLCLRGMCYMHYRGSNCASFNIAYNKSFKVKYYSKTRVDSDLPPYQVDFYYSSKDLWSTWWAIELDEIYEINSITVIPGSHSRVHEMLFEVYSSSGVFDKNVQHVSKEFWTGFPCQISITDIKENVELPCSSVSRSLLVVIYTATKPDRFDVSDVKRALLAKLISSVLARLISSVLARLISSVLARLISSVLARLISSVLARLISSVLARLMSSVLARLFSTVLARLISSVLARLISSVLARLMSSVLARLFSTVLARLISSVLARLISSVLARLISSVLARLISSFSEANLFCPSEADLFCPSEANYFCPSEADLFCPSEANLFCPSEANLFCPSEADLFCPSEANYFCPSEADLFCPSEANLFCPSEANLFCPIEANLFCPSEANLFCPSEANLFCPREANLFCPSEANLFCPSEANLFCPSEANLFCPSEANLFCPSEANLFCPSEANLFCPSEANLFCSTIVYN
ncbi:hypothetical protein Btru_044607 [Bulinus truncatus]|nr:hypothetical protein Btru_044607 [Bulinus truncatus]